MNLIIDIGNTNIKLGVFDGQTLVDQTKIDDFQRFHAFVKSHAITSAIISSVSNIPAYIIEYLNQQEIRILTLNSETPLPIINKYRTPETLGVDRISLAVGAHYLYPELNKLVIDCGTAITFDIITNKGEFIGGNISPGIGMRFKALNAFTKNLPLVSYNKKNELIGGDTISAIQAGVINGIVFEMDQYIDLFEKKYTPFTGILTGGDAFFFDKRLKKPIFVHSNILLTGLNCILHYND